jgi:hypothetical protein
MRPQNQNGRYARVHAFVKNFSSAIVFQDPAGAVGWKRTNVARDSLTLQHRCHLRFPNPVVGLDNL